MSRSLPCKQLQKHDAKAIDISFLGYFSRISDLWCSVTRNTVWCRGWKSKVSKAKVRDTSFKRFRQKDIRCLDVPMRECWAMRMNVCNPTSSTKSNGRPCFPIQWSPPHPTICCNNKNKNVRS
ncbi:hypothetical protein V8G54_037044 [Vigna mungo]|uniref:Uncharacterized protein n=1 Tax=Vigna mungo TaxID=3915 RepID=A0AAQ3MIL8_VIGMU